MPDYPRQGVFTTKEEVDAYLVGNTIQCLLCGKWYKQLSSGHLQQKHKMTPDEYRERYRLPYSRGLTGQATHAKRSRHARKLQAEGKLLRSPKGHRIIYDQPARPRQPFMVVPYKWQHKDYEAVLSRMQVQQRSLHDVCGEPDLPCESAWKIFAARHPEFAERVKQIYASWPYAVQARLHCKLSPQFTVDCRRLRAQGLSYQKIAKALDVSISTVVRHLKKPKHTPPNVDTAHLISSEDLHDSKN